MMKTCRRAAIAEKNQMAQAENIDRQPDFLGASWMERKKKKNERRQTYRHEMENEHDAKKVNVK